MGPFKRIEAVLLGGLIGASGCVADARDTDGEDQAASQALEGEAEAEADDTAPEFAEVPEIASKVDSAEFPSSGWLSIENSAIAPWCGGVLVGERQVLTSAACTEPGASALRFGAGMPGGAGIAVTRVTTLPSDPRLALLDLAEPVPNVAPAHLPSPAEAAALTEGSQAIGVSMLFAPRGTSSDRWTWRGDYHRDAEAIRVDVAAATAQQGEGPAYAGAPNCHGDHGAGVYSADGALLGIVVALADSGSSCAQSLLLATVTGVDAEAAADDTVALAAVSGSE
jgi:hypothetical protein